MHTQSNGNLARVLIIISLALLFLPSCNGRVQRCAGTVRDQRTKAIFEAVRHGDLKQIKALLDSKPNLVNAKDSVGFTSLHWAAIDGSEEVIELLLSRGADVNAPSSEGYTSLHNAARSGHKQIIKLLLDHGAAMNVRSKKGATPLGLAVDAGKTDAADFLRACGARM